MIDQYWSWLLAATGLAGFILAGKKVWWCWYINIAAQILWFAYAIITNQHGFIVAALVYTAVFAKNAYDWTMEHRESLDEKVIHYNIDTGETSRISQKEFERLREYSEGDLERMHALYTNHKDALLRPLYSLETPQIRFSEETRARMVETLREFYRKGIVHQPKEGVIERNLQAVRDELALPPIRKTVETPKIGIRSMELFYGGSPQTVYTPAQMEFDRNEYSYIREALPGEEGYVPPDPPMELDRMQYPNQEDPPRCKYTEPGDHVCFLDCDYGCSKMRNRE